MDACAGRVSDSSGKPVCDGSERRHGLAADSAAYEWPLGHEGRQPPNYSLCVNSQLSN
jgi:CDGSH-type Zn-finger protein